MRLTLRTLLAYMDDILDPADQEELGRKIESSPFATELIHRSRDAVRRVRLSAPDVLAGAGDDIHGGDHNLDANTAAEYLDNVLSPEAVADFERSCLEAGPNADMLLAEAASCHHVLTMVLGEPAEVDADLRQRMYALAQSPAAAPQVRVEPAHGPLASEARAAAPVAQQPIIAAAGVPTPAASRARAVDPDEAGVPDYILAAARERRRTRRMVAAVIGAVLIGGGLTWVFMTGGDVQTPKDVAAIGTEEELKQGPAVGDVEGPSTTASTGADAETTVPADPESQAPPFDPDAATGASTSPPALETPEVTLPPEVPAEESTPEASAPSPEPGTAVIGATLSADAADSTAASEVAAPVETVAPTADQAAIVPPAETTDAATVVAPTETGAPAGEVAVAASASPSPALPPAAVTETQTPLTASTDAAAVPPPAATATADAAMADAGAAPAGVAAPATGEATTAPAENAAAAQPKAIGAYLGNNDVLLMFNPSEKAWIRLPPRSAFMGGEQLLALPTFRTHVVLADINAYLSDGTLLELVQPGQNTGEAGAELALNIPFGRVLLNSGLNGNRVELSVVDQTRVIELGPSSSLAIEVRRIFVPGPLDRRQPAPTEIYWYLTSGSAKWGESGSADAPATWTTIDGTDSAPLAIEELPAWVDREPISDLERRARQRIAEALVPDEAVNIRLLELSDPADRGRRTEDRALAARSGAYVGLYDPLVTALGDVNQRASWRAQIEGLRQAIARDPSAVEGIHAAFALERGQESADDLMEMLLGFDRAAVGTTREEVQQGAIVRLLRWMKDDDLLYRVLAWYNVNEILNTRDIGGYKPEQTASQRERMLNRIWERFERGELMPPNAEANQ